jgi:hypothetical protein
MKMATLHQLSAALEGAGFEIASFDEETNTIRKHDEEGKYEVKTNSVKLRIIPICGVRQ